MSMPKLILGCQGRESKVKSQNDNEEKRVVVFIKLKTIYSELVLDTFDSGICFGLRYSLALESNLV